MRGDAGRRGRHREQRRAHRIRMRPPRALRTVATMVDIGRRDRSLAGMSARADRRADRGVARSAAMMLVRWAHVLDLDIDQELEEIERPVGDLQC